jgi:hypothetical protein
VLREEIHKLLNELNEDYKGNAEPEPEVNPDDEV